MIPSLLFLFLDSYLSFSLFVTGYQDSPVCLWVSLALLQSFFLAQLWLFFLFFKSKADTKLKFEKPIQQFAFFTMGLVSFLFTFTALRDLLSLAFRLSHRDDLLYGEMPTNLIIGLSLICFAIGVYKARFHISSPKVEVKISNLNQDLDGFRIVQLSDIHLGTGPNVNQVKQMVDRALSLKPDLIALTGDILME